ncbi:uncharacterized protein LOC134527956 isoform X2 [Bacillus rossius redtenbacheri]|uniref:uncharacterized protein LOC134527956 isoform X2 n=1 Tax=Bacillus rossius redtenbacheri TaxID=93214 RepID=UPI002FDCFC7A
MDDEIQETVESILGKGARVVDCEKKSSVREEEVLLVNGCPIALEGEDGAAIREALLRGTVPHGDLLNQILIRAGILRAPVRLETSLSVKSSVVTREEVTVARGGRVVDERSRETHEDNFYTSSTSEVWEPAGVAPRPASDASTSTDDSSAGGSRYYLPLPPPPPPPPAQLPPPAFYPPTVLRGGAAPTPSTASSSEDGVDCASPGRQLSNGLRDVRLDEGARAPLGVHTTASAPTIFGTVASDQTPKDGTSRRSLPQTPQAGKSYSSTLLNGGAPGGSCCSSAECAAEPAHEHALVYRDGGNLVSGSLEALVRHMVPTADYYPDRAYLFAFLLSSRLFVKPHELLGEVCALCDQQQKLGDKQAPAKERLGRFVPHLVQLLAEWTETFPYDFRDERVMGHVRNLTQKCVTIEPGVRKEVSTLLQNLLHRLTALEKYEEFLHRINADGTTASFDSLSTMDVTELCPSPALLAQQLTHVELERQSVV